MSERDDITALKDMLDHAREAVALLGKTGREDLPGNRVMQLALTRLVEITGEAANRVPDEGRRKLPDIPWAPIVGMRNRDLLKDLKEAAEGIFASRGARPWTGNTRITWDCWRR